MGEVIFGRSEAEDRMRRETMKPNGNVAIDHDFYSANPEARSSKSKEIKDEEFDGMDDKQYRLKRAIGGVMKVRQGFPMTKDID